MRFSKTIKHKVKQKIQSNHYVSKYHLSFCSPSQYASLLNSVPSQHSGTTSIAHPLSIEAPVCFIVIELSFRYYFAQQSRQSKSSSQQVHVCRVHCSGSCFWHYFLCNQQIIADLCEVLLLQSLFLKDSNISSLTQSCFYKNQIRIDGSNHLLNSL